MRTTIVTSRTLRSRPILSHAQRGEQQLGGGEERARGEAGRTERGACGEVGRPAKGVKRRGRVQDETLGEGTSTQTAGMKSRRRGRREQRRDDFPTETGG